jgi:hypothetical protein
LDELQEAVVKHEGATIQNDRPDTSGGTRNPFGVMDVPDPNGREVMEFAAKTELDGAAHDENASAWASASNDLPDTIEGEWSSRWNGGADPAIPGDSADQWKQGRAEVKAVGDRVYLHFDWGGGARRGLIDARREGASGLVGKYINLTNPEIVRPWIGLIVSNDRVDGRWPGGRLDFRR